MHDLETFGDEAAFASLREPAWHGLGTVFNEEVTTQQMLELAHLDNWNVRLEPVYVQGVPAERFAVPSFAVVRDNPFDGETDVLSVVGQRYKVLQNEELFDFGATLGSGARWETAGSIKKGRVVFGSLALERETVLDPNGVADKVNTYMLLHTSHDGSVSIQASITPVRVVCANTLNFALRSVKQSFKIRHTQTLDGKMAAAREALGLAERYMDDFDKAAQALFEVKLSDAQIEDIFATAYPKPDKDASKAAVTRWENKRVAVGEILFSDTTYAVRDSAWGMLNALTENLDWNRGVRNDNPESKLTAASGLDSIANAERNRLFSIVKEKAGI
jgi:phage/plasmid-like protein (TIGR03299 family)